MKFTDGQWQIRDGFSLYYPVEIRDYSFRSGALTLSVPCKWVNRRGDTLGDPLFTITLSSPRKEIIGVTVEHFRGVRHKGPSFELSEEAGHEAQLAVSEEAFTYTSGKLSAVISRREWKVSYYYEGRRLTGSGNRSTAYVAGADGQAYIREQLDLGVGEYVYGLGERFTPYLKNGQNVEIWNEDGGTCSEQSYKNIPFYVTNKGYGVFTNHPERVSYEVASETVSRVQFSVAGQRMQYFVVGGESLTAVLENYTNLTGKPALPPAWSFGLWLTTSFTTSYDEATVHSFIDGMKSRDIPLHVFHFDCFWMKEYQWCDFEWDKEVFPDPAGMLKRLHDKGLRVCVWINPYIGQKSPLFDEGLAGDYFVKTPSGDVWQWDKWQPGMALVDFTNPEATRWFQSKLKTLLDMGVDCFKTDFGERIPTDVVYADGSNPEKMHNYYTYLYNEAVFDLLEKTRGVGEATLFARSATVGGQKFPVHWGGDCAATYDSMAESVRGGLSLSLSGFGFWSHDISGFESTATPDIYKRWAAFGMMSSHSRLHGNSSYRVPWLFDEEAVDVLRHFTRLKSRLMPYLYDAAVTAHTRGIPTMRAMVLEFTKDPACATLDRQYMFGERLLVAPVFNDQGLAQYYLPAGKWTDFQSGRVLDGGTWVEETHDYFSLPLMVRDNSLIPVGQREDVPDYDFADGCEFHLFQLEDGKTAAASVPDIAGHPDCTVRITRDGSSLKVVRTGSCKPWSVNLRGVTAPAKVTGGTAAGSGKDTRVTPDAGVMELTIELKEV